MTPADPVQPKRDALLPCPWPTCGGAGQYVLGPSIGHKTTYTQYIMCLACNCTTPMCTTWKEAADIWNRPRIAADPVQPVGVTDAKPRSWRVSIKAKRKDGMEVLPIEVEEAAHALADKLDDSFLSISVHVEKTEPPSLGVTDALNRIYRHYKTQTGPYRDIATCAAELLAEAIRARAAQSDDAAAVKHVAERDSKCIHGKSVLHQICEDCWKESEPTDRQP